MGKAGKDIPVEKAREYVAGYTVVIDGCNGAFWDKFFLREGETRPEMCARLGWHLDATCSWGGKKANARCAVGPWKMCIRDSYQMFFRAEWLDELGMDLPNTLDEVNEYLYAVKEKDLAGNGNTIPLLCNQLSRLEYCFVGGYVEGGNGQWVDETDNLSLIHI